jgi:hypothetical protein
MSKSKEQAFSGLCELLDRFAAGWRDEPSGLGSSRRPAAGSGAALSRYDLDHPAQVAYRKSRGMTRAEHELERKLYAGRRPGGLEQRSV